MKEKITQDKLYQTLNKGDIVVFNPPYHKGIVTGKIISCTLKTVTIFL